MAVQMDLLIPPVIVGLLILAIFGINSFILETSVDTRLQNDMQTFSETSTKILQEEVRGAVEVLRPTNPAVADSVLRFVHFTGDTMRIERIDQSIAVIREGLAADTLTYPLFLSAIQFDLEPNGMNPFYLNIQLQTESNPAHHVRTGKNVQSVSAFSETEIYLRNIHQRHVMGGS
jgi:hypothetical protein